MSDSADRADEGALRVQTGAGDLDLLTPAPLAACHNGGGGSFILCWVSGLRFVKLRDYTRTKGPL